MAFKIISFICIGIVALELIGFVVFFLFILCSDDIHEEDNSDGHIICATTGHPCIKSPVTAYSCYDCVVTRDREEEEAGGTN